MTKENNFITLCRAFVCWNTEIKCTNTFYKSTKNMSTFLHVIKFIFCQKLYPLIWNSPRNLETAGTQCWTITWLQKVEVKLWEYSIFCWSIVLTSLSMTVSYTIVISYPSTCICEDKRNRFETPNFCIYRSHTKTITNI